MIVAEGTKYLPYLLLLADQDPILGLDSRCIGEIEEAWLDRWRVGAKRTAALERQVIRAGIANEQLFQRKTENPGDPILSAAGVGEAGVALGEVAEPPAEVIEPDEVLRLSGLPDGYGSASVLASAVIGGVRAWGEEADDFCKGVPTRRAGKKKGRGK